MGALRTHEGSGSLGLQLGHEPGLVLKGQPQHSAHRLIELLLRNGLTRGHGCALQRVALLVLVILGDHPGG